MGGCVQEIEEAAQRQTPQNVVEQKSAENPRACTSNEKETRSDLLRHFHGLSSPLLILSLSGKEA